MQIVLKVVPGVEKGWSYSCNRGSVYRSFLGLYDLRLFLAPDEDFPVSIIAVWELSYFLRACNKAPATPPYLLTSGIGERFSASALTSRCSCGLILALETRKHPGWCLLKVFDTNCQLR